MKDTDYTYQFSLPDGTTLEFYVDTTPVPPALDDPPDWTRLNHCQCPNCPLDAQTTEHCPTALSLVHVIESFESVESTETVQTRVFSPRREVSATTDVQTALRSLIGLIMPTSGCPILGNLRGLAGFHLPFSDRDETVFRVVASHLLEQYLVGLDGGVPDWTLDTMRELFAEVQRVDVAFANRMRDATSADAGVNAVVALFSLATLVSMSADDDLSRIRKRMLG